MKTNAARLLDSLGISYEVREYEVDPDDLAAESVAHKVGLPPEQVFKTLVAQLILGPADYLRATAAQVGPISKEK